MADLHPTELGDLFQEASPAGRPAPEHPAPQQDLFALLRSGRMRPQIQRLRFVMRYMHRVMDAAEAQAKREAKRVLPDIPALPSLPAEGGEYRLFYISPSGLQREQEFLQSYNARGLKDLLRLSSSILHSYSGLIHNSGAGPSEMSGVLASMADVLHVALNAVNSAEQLCALLEPVALQTRQAAR